MSVGTLESPVRHRRSLKSLAKAIVRPDNYVGALKAFLLIDRPIDFMSRYVRNAGSYPMDLKLRTPTGPIGIRAYSPDDIQTVNEIFLRGDYAFGGENKIIVDFGSNIGISTLYFLSRTAGSFCYGFEPLPQNIERYKANLAPFSGRYELTETAVGESNGEVVFGWEPTGRYGGIGRKTGASINVPCRDSNDELERVLAKHGAIDLLKVDIETMEKIVVERIPHDMTRHIRHIVVEYPFQTNPFPDTHRMKADVFTTRFWPI